MKQATVKLPSGDFCFQEVPGIRGVYVSECGKVFSVKNGVYYEIKQWVGSTGYYCCTMPNRTTAKGKNRKVHRLIAMALIPNPNNKPEVNHKNGVKTDNRVENLEWVTAKENSQHSVRMGLFKGKSGADHLRSIRVIQMDGDKIVRVWGGLRELKRATGFDRTDVSKACKSGRLCKGFTWKYANDSLAASLGIEKPFVVLKNI